MNIPLHEKLNSACKIDENCGDGDDEASHVQPETVDAYRIDEELLKSLEENLTDEEKDVTLVLSDYASNNFCMYAGFARLATKIQ